jgi:hypothetical protein
MSKHRDIWILDELETIVIYYPELEEENCILNTQSIFCDYQTSRIAKKNVVIEQVALGKYNISDPNFLLSAEQNQAITSRDSRLISQAIPFHMFPESHEEYLKAKQWARYLNKTGIKPGNTLFHKDFYPKYDSGGTEIDKGYFKTKKFYFPDRENNRALIIINLAHIGEKNASNVNEYGFESTGYKPDISDDKTARIHFPLSYFPPYIDYGKDAPVFWDPKNPNESYEILKQKYSHYGERGLAWANTLMLACTSKGKKITYDQIIRHSGNYGYNITVDFGIIGLGKYEWNFEHDLERFFNPIDFFTKATREYFDNGNIIRWGFAGCELFDPKNIGNANNPWGMQVTYQFYIDDPELRFYGLAMKQFQSRDSWVHCFLAGGAIPLCEPDYNMIHHERRSKYGSSEPCMSSCKYLNISPNDPSALEVFKKILGEIIGLGITFGMSFLNAAEGISTSIKVINAFIAVFKQIANRMLSSAGAPQIVVAAFNYGLYEACAYKIEKSIKQFGDYQAAKKEIKQELASAVTKYVFSSSTEDEQAQIDRIENVTDTIVEYLTKEEDVYAPHAKENLRKILATIAENKKAYLSKQYTTDIKDKSFEIIDTLQVIGKDKKTNEYSDSKSEDGSVTKIAAIAIGAVVLANMLKNK